jgi:hypothetical protein
MTKRLFDFNHWPKTNLNSYYCAAYEAAIKGVLNPEFYWPMEEQSGSISYDPRYPGDSDYAGIHAGTFWRTMDAEAQAEYIASCTPVTKLTEFDWKSGDNVGFVRVDATHPKPLVSFGDNCTIGFTLLARNTTGGRVWTWRSKASPLNDAATYDIGIDNARTLFSYRQRTNSSSRRVRFSTGAFDMEATDDLGNRIPTNLAVHVNRTASTLTLDFWVNGVHATGGPWSTIYEEGGSGALLDTYSTWETEPDMPGSIDQREFGYGKDFTASTEMHMQASHIWGIYGTPTDGQMAAIQQAWERNKIGYAP